MLANQRRRRKFKRPRARTTGVPQVHREAGKGPGKGGEASEGGPRTDCHPGAGAAQGIGRSGGTSELSQESALWAKHGQEQPGEPVPSNPACPHGRHRGRRRWGAVGLAAWGEEDPREAQGGRKKCGGRSLQLLLENSRASRELRISQVVANIGRVTFQ